jgi:hypothetical protein
LPAGPPTISNFTPSGCPGNPVVLTGGNFDPIAQNNTIYFLGEEGSDDNAFATIVGTPTPDNLIVVIPAGAVTGPIQAGNLLGQTQTQLDFTLSGCSPSTFLLDHLNLSANTGNSREPSVASEENNMIIVWEDDTPGNTEIFMRRSADGGATFTSPVNLSNSAGLSYQPSVAISGNTILVAWQDDTPENTEIFMRRSADGGATFTPPVNLSDNAEFSGYPSVAISGNNAVVTWQDYTPWQEGTRWNFEIFLRRSMDGGATFETTVNLSNNLGRSAVPSAAISGEDVVVVWYDDLPGNYDIFLCRSVDGGATFETAANLSDNAGSSAMPSVVISEKDVVVVWYDDTQGNYDIFLGRSPNGGANFIPPVHLSNNAGDSFGPSVAISGEDVVVAWYDDTLGSEEIFFRRSMNRGATFETAINLSNDLGGSAAPSVALSGEDALVVWQDGTPGSFDLFLARF